MNRRMMKILPPFALEYLASVKGATRVVVGFHQWLRPTGRPILQLQPSEIEGFLAIFNRRRASLSKVTQLSDRRHAFRYFDWLRAHHLLGFDPRCLWPRSDFEIPPQAAAFIDTLKPTLSKASIRHYQTVLRQFHISLSAQDVQLEQVGRAHITTWLKWLHERGNHACTRVGHIQNVRTYLRWLEEQPGFEGQSADHLLRLSDRPKVPHYLPRPVPFDIDQKLQIRFRKSKNLHQLGLLLMRCTGLRIGELISLPFRCTQTDDHGNTLLKVPLGKLNTERLVPLDRRTIKLLKRLRREGRRRRSLLFERAPGEKTRYLDYRAALLKACRGLEFAEPMTSHRLRHTYATTLLAGGMNLPSVMKLLGHSDYRMTLRYAAITDDIVVAEYSEAMKRNEERYALPTVVADTELGAPTRNLANLARYVLKRIDDEGLDKVAARALIRRIQRLDTALQRLFQGE